MKKHISSTILIGSLLFLTACDNSSRKTAETTQEGQAHHQDHTEAAAENTNRNVYVMKLTAASENIQAGKPVVLKLMPQIKGKEDIAVPLDMVHDKKIHLIIVSEDLAYFDHIHPEYQADGSYQVAAQFPAGSNYLLYADYQPTGAGAQLEKINVKVSGKPQPRASYTVAKMQSAVEGYTVALQPGNPLATGSSTHIAAVVKYKDKEIPASQLEDYLGAKAHVVIIGTEHYDYLHVHPEVQNDRLDLHTTFSTPGIYRGWLQFKTKGKVYTTDFVLEVKQGKAQPEENSHHHHEHSDHAE